MNPNHEASPEMPGAGYQDTNDRDISAKQDEGVRDSEAAHDESVNLDGVKVLPGTGGPDDTGDETVPDDYDPTGHAGGAEPENEEPRAR